MDRYPSLPSLTRTPTRVSYQNALFLILAAVVFALFLPFSRHLIPTDHDALATIAQIRSTGSLLGWYNGYFFNGILIGCVNGVVNLFGRTQDDYLLAY